MFCASATGELLPPYVVYKGKNVYPSWCQGGPKGAVYTATSHGWFDIFSFEDWFFKLYLTHVRRMPGKKLLIGDNLSSHLSLNVSEKIKKKDKVPVYPTLTVPVPILY